jgi:hypothetical protein
MTAYRNSAALADLRSGTLVQSDNAGCTVLSLSVFCRKGTQETKGAGSLNAQRSAILDCFASTLRFCVQSVQVATNPITAKSTTVPITEIRTEIATQVAAHALLTAKGITMLV